MSKRWLKDKDKGDKFEEKVHQYLIDEASKYGRNWEVKTVVDVLGEGEYRWNGLRYPDFTVVSSPITLDEGDEIQLIDAKNKSGWRETGHKIYVGVEKKYVDDYIELSKLLQSKVVAFVYCTITNKAYIVEKLDSPDVEKVWDNKFSDNIGDITYGYDVENLFEISELENCC